MDISGLWAMLPSSAAAQGSSRDAMATKVAMLNNSGLRGFVLPGPVPSSHDDVAASNACLEHVRAVRAAAGPEKLILAGCGLRSRQATVDLGRRLAAAGADGLLVAPPRLPAAQQTPKVLEAHLNAVADAAGSPVVLHDNPETGVHLGSCPTLKFVAQHPNVIGMLDGFRSRESVKALARIRIETTKYDFQILAGSAGTLLPALSIGAVGGVSDLARVAPEPLLAITAMLTQRAPFTHQKTCEGQSKHEGSRGEVYGPMGGA